MSALPLEVLSLWCFEWGGSPPLGNSLWLACRRSHNQYRHPKKAAFCPPVLSKGDQGPHWGAECSFLRVPVLMVAQPTARLVSITATEPSDQHLTGNFRLDLPGPSVLPAERLVLGRRRVLLKRKGTAEDSSGAEVLCRALQNENDE